MTAQKTKPTQKRLNNCVLSPLRWAKIYEKLENCACGTLKIKDAVANAAVRVANAPKEGQASRNTTLLGKYPLKLQMNRYRPAALSFLVAFALAFLPVNSQAQTVKKAHIVASEFNGVKRSYSYRRVVDPTGEAKTRRVERFELRAGLCKNSDCERRPYTRSRYERQNITSLREGSEAWYTYQIYFPSAEFNPVPHVSTTFGQLYLNSGYPSNWDGVAIWHLKSAEDGRTMELWYKQADKADKLNLKKVRIGTLGTESFPYDTWIDVKVYIKLSTGSDGRILTYINDRQVMSLKGPTIWRGARLEYDYGIYQSGISRWEKATGRNKSEIPPQVVYYSGVLLGSVQ